MTKDYVKTDYYLLAALLSKNAITVTELYKKATKLKSELEGLDLQTCQIRNDDTGELKTMTREAAKKLQAETKDTCDWLSPVEFTSPDPTPLSLTYVCPIKDIECGRNPANWCQRCPQKAFTKLEEKAMSNPTQRFVMVEVTGCKNCPNQTYSGTSRQYWCRIGSGSVNQCADLHVQNKDNITESCPMYSQSQTKNEVAENINNLETNPYERL